MLVEPMQPRNVGAAARAMKNFGLRDLSVVGRPVHKRSPARWMASGAEDVLGGLAHYKDLAPALEDRQLVLATSARLGGDRDRMRLVAREAAAEMVAAARQGRRVALLFGREDRGLTNEQLRPCEILVRIPTGDAHPVLNLAQSVAVLSYELHVAGAGEALPPKTARGQVDEVSSGDIDALMTHLKGLLGRVGFWKGDEAGERVVERFRRLAAAGRLSAWELRTLRGMLSRIELCLDRPELQRSGEAER